MTAQDTETTEFAAEWEHWHKQHEDRLAAPDGFLAITSINWLTETPTRFADAPGVWAADDSGAYQTSAQAGPYPSGASGYRPGSR